MTHLTQKKLNQPQIELLLEFFSQVGRNREDSDAWVHAIVDIGESYERIFSTLVPEALDIVTSTRDKQEIFWDIREELRHIEYHVTDVMQK